MWSVRGVTWTGRWADIFIYSEVSWFEEKSGKVAVVWEPGSLPNSKWAKKFRFRMFILPETNNENTWKWMVRRRSLPFGALGLFSGASCEFWGGYKGQKVGSCEGLFFLGVWPTGDHFLTDRLLGWWAMMHMWAYDQWSSSFVVGQKRIGCHKCAADLSDSCLVNQKLTPKLPNVWMYHSLCGLLRKTAFTSSCICTLGRRKISIVDWFSGFSIYFT